MDVYQKIVSLHDMSSDLSADDQADNNVIMLSIFPIQLTNTTGTHLHHLNEDCLLEIFSSKLLTPMDLCSLAETSTRFKQITQRVFPKDYMIAREYRGNEFRTKSFVKFYKELRDVERILKSFGQHLSKLSISRKGQDILDLIAEHCGDVTLKNLKIYSLHTMDGVIMQLNSIFERLLKLFVYHCDLLRDVQYQTLNCDSLVELKIVYSSGCFALLNHIFPNLKRFTWYCSYIYAIETENASSHILFRFIRRHGHLKIIYICDESVCSSELLYVMDISCKELEELTLEGLMSPKGSFDFSTLDGLAKLKILDVDFVFKNYIDRYIVPLQAFKSLETIKISRVYQVPVRFFDVLSQLQNLRELRLVQCNHNHIPWKMLVRLRKVCLDGTGYEFYGADLINIIRQLINLEELEYTSNWWDSLAEEFYLSKEDFGEIAGIVERRKHLLTLKCSFKFSPNCIETQKVRLINLYDGCDSDED